MGDLGVAMEEKSVYLTRDPTAKSKLTKMKLMARPCAIFEPISKTKSLKRIAEGVKIHILSILSPILECNLPKAGKIC